PGCPCGLDREFAERGRTDLWRGKRQTSRVAMRATTVEDLQVTHPGSDLAPQKVEGPSLHPQRRGLHGGSASATGRFLPSNREPLCYLSRSQGVSQAVRRRA